MHWGLATAELVIFLGSTILHEAAHAFGMVALPALSLLMGGHVMGWASTPYDPAWAEREPRKAAWMGLAGPAANLGLVLLAAFIIHGGIALGYFRQPGTIRFEQVVVGLDEGWSGAFAVLLSLLFSLNLLLLAFNLVPFPPLDGAALWTLLPGSESVVKFLRQPGLGLVGLLVAWHLFPHLFGPIHTAALNLLYPGSGYR
jgi:Zn-dependent protease